MTEKDKKLLLKDLCARLPYGVMFNYNKNLPLKVEGIVRNTVYYKGYNYQTEGDECYAYITECKPYLRPMSSMTEEEKENLQNLIDEKLNYGIDSENEWSSWVLYDNTGIKNMIGGERFYFDDMSFIYDWLNAHHFDYRGLIEKGLALEAPEGMYKTE